MIKFRKLKRHNNRSLTFTELGFGTAPLGNLYKSISDDEAARTLELAWDYGVRYYDTAPLYGLGLSETRLNRFLRGKPRDDYVISSKVGRVLKVCSPKDRDGIGKWFEVPDRNQHFDYSYDGIMRSIEFSLERLGLSRLDIIYAHDLCIFTHGSKQDSDRRINEFFQKNSSNVQIHVSLGRYLYHGLLGLAKTNNYKIVCVGNSSSGIKETPAFSCPTVNIGSRQEGRLRGENVIDVGYKEQEIKEAIRLSLTDNFISKCKSAQNPYWLGDAGPKIAKQLAEVKLDKKLIRKKMTINGHEKNGWFK